MANKIHILRTDLANKIAAGEVVQRPASAVKELLENALDAGATKIEVLVRDGGRTLLQVIDNGEGMSEDDALLAFERHATSKISTAADLECIRTLGFRGEALASIAAVAQVEMKTRTENDDLATLLRIEGSELKERSRASWSRGTSVAVRNLFFNTPARRNFLKTQPTELKNITDAVTRLALAYPEVAWVYQSDDEVLLNVPVQPIEKRLAAVLGERMAGGLVLLKESTELLTLNGFIGKPDFARKARAENYVFLNRRYISSRMVQHAVFQAYEHLLERGSFPFFILHIDIDPKRVDVNVHPSKMEVKFDRESDIYRMVLSVVRKTLAAHDLFPRITFQEGTVTQEMDERLRFASPSGIPSLPSDLHGGTPVFTLRPDHRISSNSFVETNAPILPMEDLFPRVIGPEALKAPIFPSNEPEPPVADGVLAHTVKQMATAGGTDREVRAIWQVHNKYIVSQVKSGLMIVDQHVAHERILYERVLENFENSLPTSQQLLFPQTVELSTGDYSLVKDLMPHLDRLGFDVKPFGRNTVVIEGIPADVKVGSERKILQDVLDEFKNNQHTRTIDVRDNIAASFACKAAIKAGDRLNTNEMIVLIDQLFATRMPYVCPHGRPIVIKIPIEELDKRFGRT